MSDIDYSKYSYRNHKNGRSGTRQKGKIRYNFANYDTYIKDIRENDKVYEHQNTDTGYQETIELNGKETEEDIEIEEEKMQRIMEDKVIDVYNIEDMRTRKSAELKHKTKKETNKPSRKRRDIIAILMIVICFSLTIASVDIITRGGIFNNLSNVFANQTSIKVYYAVEVGSYPDINSAKSTAEIFRSRNAGGYVVNDKSYRVIAAVYKDKSDAEAIVAKLIGDGIAATIYEMKTSSVDYSKYDDLGPYIEEVMEGCLIIYDRLYIISNSLDKEEITKADAKVDIIRLRTEIQEICDRFVNETKEYDDSVIMSVKTELIAYIAILDNLVNDKAVSHSLISDIRYSYTMILNMYCALTRAL